LFTVRKTTVIIQKLCIALLGMSFFAALPVSGQPGPRPAASAASNAPPGPPPAQTLTTEQLAKVKSVLAAYKPATLTTDDAKMIKRTLRDAGMRPGPAMNKALADAGFSAERLDVLAPPPPRPAGEGNTPPPPNK
jgi:hypothetical protein